MAITRSDVARAAGVSPAVVSYVLNNGPRPVAPSTRARVEEAISKLNYRPNAIASALRGGSSRSIGLLSPNPQNPFYAELTEAVERKLREQRYLVLTGHTYYDRTQEERYLSSFFARKVDGLILSSGISLTASGAADLGVQPVVALDHAPEGTSHSSVAPDDMADAAVAVEHLQRHGHRLIACVGGPPHVRAEGDRIVGWQNQQVVSSAPAGEDLLALGEPSEQGGFGAAVQLLSEHGRPWAMHGQRPSAIFVASDFQAIGVLFACLHLGLRVPQDVAISSVGGTNSARYTIPPLTTVRQDKETLASIGVAHLLERIEHPGVPPLRMSIRGNLVVGQSCGCRPYGVTAR